MELFKVYTDLDSMMDPRYGILSKLLEPKKLKFEDVFADTYNKRVVDRFERKDIGITQRDFDYAFTHRSVNDLHYYRPSKLLSCMLKMIVDMNDMTGRSLEVAGIDLTVNLWPYEFDEALKDYLYNEIKVNMPYIEEISFIFKPFQDINMGNMKNFTHALSYYLFNGSEYSNFQTTLEDNPCPDLKCAVPSLHIHENEISEHVSPEDIRVLGSVMLAHVVTIIPCNPWTYDYIPIEKA